MSTKPSLETCAELYRAAKKIKNFTERWRAVYRVIQSAKSHGYTEGQIYKAARASDQPASK